MILPQMARHIQDHRHSARMQNLHRNFAARLMNAVCNDLMIGNIGFVKQPRRAWKNAAFAVRRDALLPSMQHHHARVQRKIATRFQSFVSSKLVCIDPIRTRFFNVVKPRSNGARRLKGLGHLGA